MFLPFKAILPFRCLVCKDLGEEMDYPASGSLRLVERRESISQNMKLGRPIKAGLVSLDKAQVQRRTVRLLK